MKCIEVVEAQSLQLIGTQDLILSYLDDFGCITRHFLET